MEILKREHFNRWYKLGPFIISTLAIEIPFQVRKFQKSKLYNRFEINTMIFFQILCCVTYISVSYVMTGNLLVNFRFLYFFIIATSTSLCAQSWGYFIGATTPVKVINENKIIISIWIHCIHNLFSDRSFHRTRHSRIIFSIWILYPIFGHSCCIPLAIPCILF